MKPVLPLLLAAALLVASPASAPAQTSEEAAAVFERHDRDGDGSVTPGELPNKQAFARYDTDRNGSITLEEYREVLGRTARPKIAPEDVKKVTSGPGVLKPGDAGIGRMVPDAAFTDLAGKERRLSEFEAHKGLVIAMTSATCPVSKRYLPSLAALEKELATQDVALLLVNPFASESAGEIRAQLEDHAFTAAYVHDKEKAIAAALQARTTTEVFLLDAARTLAYRGALDDQYGINYSLDAPGQRYLRDAVAALLENETPRIAATAAPGCELDLGDAPKLAAPPVTWHRDVARILGQNCVRCHRDGGIAPFALDDLDEVKDRAKVIRRVVTEETMPPWFAAPRPDDQSSPWANDCSLSTRDKTDLVAWIESSDRPLGDPADAPARRVYPAEWSIGTPDLVVPLSRAYDIKADGVMPYQFDLAETHLTEDRWVSAYEILPSERDVVHHVIVNVHEKGSDARERGDGAGDYWAVYVPGNGSHIHPAGFARRLPAGSRVSFQIHYTPSGTAKKERLRLGLVFADSPPRYEVKTVGVSQPRIAIPPGASHHVETRAQHVDFDVPVTSLMAHMHVRGKAFKYEVAYPDGRTETLLNIPRYDFNWQLRYDLKEPRLIPRGSTLTITAVYDNSAANKANPDPGKLVKWGGQTYDEMMIGYLEYFVPLAAAGVAAK